MMAELFDRFLRRDGDATLHVSEKKKRITRQDAEKIPCLFRDHDLSLFADNGCPGIFSLWSFRVDAPSLSMICYTNHTIGRRNCQALPHTVFFSPAVCGAGKTHIKPAGSQGRIQPVHRVRACSFFHCFPYGTGVGVGARHPGALKVTTITWTEYGSGSNSATGTPMTERLSISAYTNSFPV